MERALRNLAAAILSIVPFAATAQTQAPYLTDVLKDPAYHAGWSRMLGGARPPAWLVTFSRTGNGVVTPMTPGVVAGRPVEFFSVCKPHDCGSNRLEVMFESGGGKARGALVVDDRPPRFLGRPDAAERAALVKAMNE